MMMSSEKIRSRGSYARRPLWFLLLGATLAQEKPFVEIPRFTDEPGWDFRTNVCDRQRAVLNNTIPLKDALSGLDLSVAMTNYAGGGSESLFGLSAEGGIKYEEPGLFVVLMDEVARRAKFSWRNSYAAIDPLSPGVDGNKTWTNLLRWETLHFDIAADYWGRSRERMALGISFPKGWYDGSIILAQSVPKLGTGGNKFATYFSFLLPFDYKVWVLILGSIIFTGLMYMALERLNTESDERELEDKPLTSIFIASLTFTGHFQFRPQTNAARLLSFSWTFWALIIMSAYTANMASFLVSRNDKTVYVSTLEDALKTGTPICIQRFSVMDDIVSKKYPEMKIIRKDTEIELFQSLRLDPYGAERGCLATLTNLGTFELFQGNKEVNYDCSLTTEKRVVQSLPSGFATGVDTGTLCTSLISFVLNIHFTEMVADGFVAAEWGKHVFKISSIDCAEELANVNRNRPIDEDETFSLRLEEMGGIFILHLILTVVAVLFALVDLQQRVSVSGNAANERPSNPITEVTRTSSQPFDESELLPHKKNDIVPVDTTLHTFNK